MIAELANHEETKNVAKEGGFVHAHTMPGEEPLAREEATFRPRSKVRGSCVLCSLV
jgi:hypothetical protein